MKIQLAKDSLFEVKQSPVKELKQKQLERQRLLRMRRMNPISQKKQFNFEIVDPLPLQLKQYRTETTYKKSTQTSKASESLKKYIIQQQQNLRCLRLERSHPQQQSISSRRNSFKMSISQIEDSDKFSRQINIPRIEDLFKNQIKQNLLYQNRQLSNKLGSIINDLDRNVIHKFTADIHGHEKDIKNDNKITTNVMNHANFFSTMKNPDDDYNDDLDPIIARKLKKSFKLRQKLYKQKKQMSTQKTQNNNNDLNNKLSYFISQIPKIKRKIPLQGVKSFSYKNGQNKLEITPASSLLFELNKLMRNKDKKQQELTGLLKNSYQNRDSILDEKSNYYDVQTTFSNLNPSNQMKLRQVMNKKLQHRLQLSKEQVNNYIHFLKDVQDYHMIINETIISILKEVRTMLLNGKVMKISDLSRILQNYDKQQFKGHPNQQIIQKLIDMMI